MDGIRFHRFTGDDADWLVEAHSRLYAEAEGFDASFGVLVAGIVDEFLASHDPVRERGWIARLGSERLGSIFCVRGPGAGMARLRLFLVTPEARGTGLGRRLLETCMSFARGAGYRRMALWTHESHKAACALYASAGFVCTEARPVRNFGVDLVEQNWETDL